MLTGADSDAQLPVGFQGYIHEEIKLIAASLDCVLNNFCGHR
jgi:hypothetical protein